VINDCKIFYFTYLLIKSSEFIVFSTDDRDRNDEIQQLLARVEYNARQYMTSFNLASLTSSSSSALVKIVPLSVSTKNHPIIT